MSRYAMAKSNESILLINIHIVWLGLLTQVKKDLQAEKNVLKSSEFSFYEFRQSDNSCI